MNLGYLVSAAVFRPSGCHRNAAGSVASSLFLTLPDVSKVTSAGMCFFPLILGTLRVGVFHMDINIKQISWNLEASRLSISVNEQRLWVNKETLFFRRLHHCLHSQKRTFILWRLTLPWLQPPEPEWLRFHDFLCGKSTSLILVSAPVPTISLNRIKSTRWSLCGPPVIADNYSKRCLGCS